MPIDQEKAAAPTSPKFLVNQASLQITTKLKPFLAKVSLDALIGAFKNLNAGRGGTSKLGKVLEELFLGEVKQKLADLGSREDAYKTPEFQTWFSQQVLTDVLKSLERGEVKEMGPKQKQQKQADLVSQVLATAARNLSENLGAKLSSAFPGQFVLSGGKFLSSEKLVLRSAGRNSLQITWQSEQGDYEQLADGVRDEIELMETVFDALRMWGIVKYSDKERVLRVAEVKPVTAAEDAAEPKWSEEEAKKIGSSIGIDWEKVSWTPATLLKGMLVELEHGTRHKETNITNNDPKMTAKIAWAHLMEGASYYEELDKLEQTLKKGEEKKDEAAVVKTSAAGASFNLTVRIFSADWWHPDPKEMPYLLEKMKVAFAKLKRALGGVGGRVVPIRGTNLQGYESVFTFPSLKEAKKAARQIDDFDLAEELDYNYSISKAASPEFTQFVNKVAAKYPEFYREWVQHSESWDDLVEARPTTWMASLEKWAVYLTLTALGPDLDFAKLGRYLPAIRKLVPRGDILKGFETGNLEVALTKAGLLGRKSDRLRNPADRYF